jgi:hypothetical protein
MSTADGPAPDTPARQIAVTMQSAAKYLPKPHRTHSSGSVKASTVLALLLHLLHLVLHLLHKDH